MPPTDIITRFGGLLASNATRGYCALVAPEGNETELLRQQLLSDWGVELTPTFEEMVLAQRQIRDDEEAAAEVDVHTHNAATLFATDDDPPSSIRVKPVLATPVGDRILAILNSATGPLRPAELAAMLPDDKEATVRVAVWHLWQNGRIDRVSYGKYARKAG